jgi:hypothetical protein
MSVPHLLFVAVFLRATPLKSYPSAMKLEELVKRSLTAAENPLIVIAASETVIRATVINTRSGNRCVESISISRKSFEK